MKDLRTWRIAHNLTQAEAAAKLGASQEMIARIEAGTREPSPELAAKISKLLADSSARGSSSRGPYFGGPRTTDRK